MRVLFCASHPDNCNGYARVVHAMARGLALDHGVQVIVFGFSHVKSMTNSQGHRESLKDVRGVTVLDAFQLDGCKGQGFGFSHLRGVVHEYQPDVVLVHNDINIVARVVDALQGGSSGVPVMAYIDLVYRGIRPACVSVLNRCVSVVGYSARWAAHLVEQGVTVPVYHAGHGVDRDVIYPIPKRLARAIFNLHTDDFIVLNMNTNITRKRWDVCLSAWALVVADHMANGGPFPKLVINANLTGAWDLLHVYAVELKEAGVDVEKGMRHIVPVASGHTLSDFHVNALYNAADVGVSVGDGEGYGLCAVEHMSVGRPVVASAVGGHLDIKSDSVTLVPPACRYHVDGSRVDGGGIGEIVAAPAVASLLLQLRHDKTGTLRKARLATETPVPGWKVAVSDMHDALYKTVGTLKEEAVSKLPELRPPASGNVLELENIAHALREVIAKIK